MFCLESLEPPRELAWGLQQQGSSPQPFPTETQASTTSCCTSYPRAQARCPIPMASPPAPPWQNSQESYQGLTDRLPATLNSREAADTFVGSNNKGLSPTANSMPAINSPCLGERSLLPFASPLGPTELFVPTSLLGQARKQLQRSLLVYKFQRSTGWLTYGFPVFSQQACNKIRKEHS